MRKLLYTLILLVGMTTYGQNEISLNVGHLQAMEFIGDDIKNGVAVSLRGDLDLFRKKAFVFGPTASFYKLGEIASDIESIDKEEVASLGLNMGFRTNNTLFKLSYQLPVSEQDPIFKSVMSGSLAFGKKAGVKVGFDYFFNRNLFHYTYSINTGLFIRF